MSLVIFALTTIIWGIEPTWCWLGRNASNIAAWVQAIGVFVALYAAINAPKWSREHSSKHFERMLYTYLKTGLEVTEYVSNAVNSDNLDIEISHLRALHESGLKPLFDFPVMELNNHNIAREVIILSTFCKTALSALNNKDAMIEGAAAMNHLVGEFKTILKKFWSESGDQIRI